MSIATAKAYRGKWYDSKKTLLNSERFAINTAFVKFAFFLQIKKQQKFSIPEALFDAALKSAVDAVPGGFVLTSGWNYAVETAKIVTKEGKELAKLGVEKGYDAAIDFAGKVKNAPQSESRIVDTKLEIVNRYLEKTLKPINKEIIETLYVSNTWRDILARWPSQMGDPEPVIKSALGGIPNVSEERLKMFGFALYYYLIGAYVKENVVVEKIRNQFDFDNYKINVKGLNDKQLASLYHTFGSASAMPKDNRKAKDSFHRLEGIHHEYELFCFKDTELIKFIKSDIKMKHWKQYFSATKLKDINDPLDLVTVWGAREQMVNPSSIQGIYP